MGQSRARYRGPEGRRKKFPRSQKAILDQEVGGVQEKGGLERRLNIGQDYSNIKYPSPAGKSKVEG